MIIKLNSRFSNQIMVCLPSMEHTTLKTLSLQELKNLRGLVNKEIDSRQETICKKETRQLEKGYEIYRLAVQNFGPKAAALEISGWSFGKYLKYMSARNPHNDLRYITEIFEEEMESRNKVWFENRSLHLSQHTPYVSLTRPYEPK